MSSRRLAASIIICIFLIIGIYAIYARLQAKHTQSRIFSNQNWLGVIDMDHDHGIDMKGVQRGDDVLLVIDYNNPHVQQLIQKNRQFKPASNVTEFELGNFDANGDQVLTSEDPIYPYLRIIYFNPDKKVYQSRDLRGAGIRGIKIKHLTPHGNHEVIMSDGTRRILYEINKPGGTAIYKNNKGMVVIPLPE